MSNAIQTHKLDQTTTSAKFVQVLKDKSPSLKELGISELVAYLCFNPVAFDGFRSSEETQEIL